MDPWEAPRVLCCVWNAAAGAPGSAAAGLADAENGEALLHRGADERWREEGRERRQLLESVPKWMNEWVTHINDCCDGLT